MPLMPERPDIGSPAPGFSAPVGGEGFSDGKIAAVFPKVKPDAPTGQLLEVS